MHGKVPTHSTSCARATCNNGWACLHLTARLQWHGSAIYNTAFLANPQVAGQHAARSMHSKQRWLGCVRRISTRDGLKQLLFGTVPYSTSNERQGAWQGVCVEGGESHLGGGEEEDPNKYYRKKLNVRNGPPTDRAPEGPRWIGAGGKGGAGAWSTPGDGARKDMIKLYPHPPTPIPHPSHTHPTPITNDEGAHTCHDIYISWLGMPAHCGLAAMVWLSIPTCLPHHLKGVRGMPSD